MPYYTQWPSIRGEPCSYDHFGSLRKIQEEQLVAMSGLRPGCHVLTLLHTETVPYHASISVTSSSLAISDRLDGGFSHKVRLRLHIGSLKATGLG